MMRLNDYKWYDLAIVVLVVGTAAISMIILLGRTLGDNKIDTTPISNVGFAVLAALATLSFNWAKTFDVNIDEQKIIAKQLNRAGSRAVFASICFIVASLSKYIFREFDRFKDAIPLDEGFVHFMFGIGFIFPFIAAMVLVHYVIGRLSLTYLQAIRIFK